MRKTVAVAVLGVLAVVPAVAKASHSFTDVPDQNTFHGDISWLADEGITRGCNPPNNDSFCPDGFVTRGQMAAFLVRGMDYTDEGVADRFVDDDDSVFESDIDKLAAAGVTYGCNPPVNDRFCPDDLVTRGQMAAFLVRARAYTDDGGGDLFVDDDGSTFAGDVDRLGWAGVTKGCNPPDNDRFCPDDFVTRGQMAAFLHRALGPVCDVADVAKQDCVALEAFHEATKGENWFNVTSPARRVWFATPAVCNWEGVVCTGTRVTGLVLRNNGLVGEIPPEIQQLTRLKQLQLPGNGLTGSVPSEIGDLSELVILDLTGAWWDNSALTGPIPPEIGNLPRLATLNLSENALSGPIPESLYELSNLHVFWARGNVITGSIPPTIGRLTRLTSFDLSGNQLTGPIPAEIGNLTELVNLALSGNQISGSIPPEIGNLSSLTKLRLTSNQLSGSMPDQLSQLTQLETLWLGGNQLTGPIPSALGQLSNLIQFAADDNLLTGAIPSELGNLIRLTGLSLSNNDLSGPIPDEIGAMPALRGLGLAGNQLTGQIPTDLGTNSRLSTLTLAGNALTGQIPPTLGNMAGEYVGLDLSNNDLVGAIPAELGDVTVFESGVVDINLSNNELDGEVPSSLLSLPHDTNILLRGQTGCLFTTDPQLEVWLSDLDPLWNDGCS